MLAHAGGIFAIVYASLFVFSWWTFGLGALWFALCMISNTGGYHRLFAHRAYDSAGPLRFFYLFFGAASGQGSALQWASDHRVHHAHTDEENDPHNIKKGFWWAHIGWLLYRMPPSDFRNVQDLAADPLIRFQHRFYLFLAGGVGFLFPMLLAWTWGDPLGGLLTAGFLRLALQYQATFCINSVTHKIGRQPYSRETSARDSFVAAIVTMGEGYHNFHHAFPGDYRNGVRFWQFDPTKWWVWSLSKVGLTRRLRRTSAEAIQAAKARICVEHSA